jgi:hypothetical protein
MNEFSKYARMRDDGFGADEVYRAAKADGLTEVESIRMLRAVFGLSLAAAKEVTVVSGGAVASLDEHLAHLATALGASRRSPTPVVRFPGRRGDGSFAVRVRFSTEGPSVVPLVRDYVACWVRSNRVWVRIWRSDIIQEERLELASELRSDPAVECDAGDANGAFSIVFECLPAASRWKDWIVRLARDIEVVFPEVKCTRFE